ncbi:GNAT family acetyltransferase [Vibrio sp. D404a]|uniref:GNAT family N-acetyltransferase n=1 Tax=unclassified Vibrio TaxID=2614977 RepID=UPI0025528E0C|nr:MULTISPECIES: GNAT family acetyltransferase [unclassified Vibrio]MDK9738257.1 GNAT family acetyltransferase [Vibrio sp. D404a]MDK9796548.1 GNAT family acetyltransferase [Vibrio sp. D449a]
MEVRAAKVEDIEQIVELQKSCHVSNLDASDKSDGFLNTVLGEELLKQVIEQEQAVFVVEFNRAIVGMAVCASWAFWQCSEALTKVANGLGSVEVEGAVLTKSNSYFWGPVCVGKACRGQGVFEQLFTFSSLVKSSDYPYVYTYVHKDNTRSFAAHTNKVGFRYIKDFELNEQIFQEMIRPTEIG